MHLNKIGYRLPSSLQRFGLFLKHVVTVLFVFITLTSSSLHSFAYKDVLFSSASKTKHFSAQHKSVSLAGDIFSEDSEDDVDIEIEFFSTTHFFSSDDTRLQSVSKINFPVISKPVGSYPPLYILFNARRVSC